jgi:hypothetical protein
MRPEKTKPSITIAGEGLQNINIYSALRGVILAGRDVYRATPAVTWGLGFSGLIRRTSPLSRLLRHTGGCRRYTLTRILADHHSVASYDTQGDAEVTFLPGSTRMDLSVV